MSDDKYIVETFHIRSREDLESAIEQMKDMLDQWKNGMSLEEFEAH
jgi:hypothetical protein